MVGFQLTVLEKLLPMKTPVQIKQKKRGDDLGLFGMRYNCHATCSRQEGTDEQRHCVTQCLHGMMRDAARINDYGPIAFVEHQNSLSTT